MQERGHGEDYARDPDPPIFTHGVKRTEDGSCRQKAGDAAAGAAGLCPRRQQQLHDHDYEQIGESSLSAAQGVSRRIHETMAYIMLLGFGRSRPFALLPRLRAVLVRTS